VLQYLSNELSVADEDKTKWYHHWLGIGFSAFESLLQANDYQGSYCMGRELSMADACLIPQIYNADRFGFAMDDFPRLSQINKNCMKLSAFDKAKPENQVDSQ
jgi:maleylacetoacetate isomerase